MVEAKKNRRDEEKFSPLLCSSNCSSISQKNLMHQKKKYKEKNLNLVEEEKIRDEKDIKNELHMVKARKNRRDEEKLLPLLFLQTIHPSPRKT